MVSVSLGADHVAKRIQQLAFGRPGAENQADYRYHDDHHRRDRKRGEKRQRGGIDERLAVDPVASGGDCDVQSPAERGHDSLER